MNLSKVKWAQWDKTQSRELLVCSYVCASHCAQLLHTILHRTDLIVFPLTLQTITIYSLQRNTDCQTDWIPDTFPWQRRPAGLRPWTASLVAAAGLCSLQVTTSALCQSHIAAHFTANPQLWALPLYNASTPLSSTSKHTDFLWEWQW